MCAIRITDTLSIPVLKVVVDADNSFDPITLASDIANLSVGFASVGACWGNESWITPHNETYGDTTGFKLETSQTGVYGTQQITLYFNNVIVGRCQVYSGYANWEFSPLTIYVDTYNNIISIDRNNVAGIGGPYLLYTTNPGLISLQDSITVGSIQPDYSIKTDVLHVLYTNVIVGNITDYIVNEITSDPYSLAGDSAPGGGGGSWGDLSDSIDFPSLPTLSAIGTGFITLYTPTVQQLSNLANYMWNGNPQTLDFWRKIVADPIDLILGLNIIPVALPASGTRAVTVGGLSTDVDMTYTATQYVEIDCGSLSVPEFYGAYLDYAPYTKFDLYLPYCGTHPLIADEIVGKTIHIKYHVDALSGACIAYVKCGDSVLYEFSGNVCAQIPVTANQFGDMVRSAISIASAIGTMVATDGATAPMAVGAIASAGTNSMGLKPTVEKSGAIGGMAGQLGIQKPYLIITRPSLCIPKNQNMFMGYPSFVTVLLNDLHGYNEISSIHIENVPATDTELSEIETLLKSGVIF